MKLRVLPLTLLIGLLSCGQEHRAGSRLFEAWDPFNDPSNAGPNQTSALPLQSMSTTALLSEDERPWGSYYWATRKGGISYRYQTFHQGASYRDYLYTIPDSAAVASLTPDAIKLLSPSEKFDIFMNRADLPLTQYERQTVLDSVINGEVPEWWGLCHGWAHASYSEPRPGPQVTVTNASGQEITFYADDLKALLAKVYGYHSAPVESSDFVGTRCNIVPEFDERGRVVSTYCRDSNPGSFHLVLVDFFQRRRQSLVADLDPGYEVWNYPLVGYQYTASNLRAIDANDPLADVRAPTAVSIVDISLDLTYVIDQLDPVPTQTPDYLQQMHFDYTLELDSGGRVVGGEWAPHTKVRPDFLWRIRNAPQQSDVPYLELDALRELIRLSRET